METQEQFTFDIDGARLGWFFLTRFLWSVKFSGGHWLLYTLLLSVWFVLITISILIEPFILLLWLLILTIKSILQFIAKNFLNRILRIMALPVAVLIIYALYKSGLWHELYLFFLELFSEFTFSTFFNQIKQLLNSIYLEL